MRIRVPWLGVLAVVNVVLCGWSLVSYLHLDLRVALANDQTRFIVMWRDRALASKNADGVGLLQMIVHEYPSGTKQIKGSSLDQMVERQRADAVREVLAHLRKETSQDLGNDPDVWIAKYTKN
jgi:hypothetical protein